MGTTLKAKQLMASTFITGTLSVPTHIAWGDSSTAFTINDTTLGNELERNAYSDTTLASQTVEFNGVLTTGELIGSTIYETGLLDASSSGNLFARDIFDGIEKTNQFEVETIFIVRIK